MRVVIAIVAAMLSVTTGVPVSASVSDAAADVAVTMRVIDDATDPQRLRVTLTNYGPSTAQYPVLRMALDQTSGRIISHNADPVPGSFDDGVGCEPQSQEDPGIACTWRAIAANETINVDVHLEVIDDVEVVALVQPAGTPDPNPGSNNHVTVLLTPAVADLVIRDVRFVDQTLRTTNVVVEVEHRGGRDTHVNVVVPTGVGVLTGTEHDCYQRDLYNVRCKGQNIAAGESAQIVVPVERPHPGEDPNRVDVTLLTEVALKHPQMGYQQVLVEPHSLSYGTVRRHAGQDRIETATRVSQSLYGDNEASIAVVTRADVYADALSGAPLAAAWGGPMLLTAPESFPATTAAELVRVLSPGGTVVVLGGEQAVSHRVVEQIRALGYQVNRVSGENRYATSMAVYDALGRPSRIAAADGDTFIDAVIGGSVMATKSGALVLTSGSTLPSELEPIADHIDWAIGDAASAAVPGARRLAGTSPAETSVIVAQAFYAAPSSVTIATDATFPDALAGGPLAAQTGGAMLITSGRAIAPSVSRYIRDTPTVRTAHLLGGTAALSRHVEQGVVEALAQQ